MESLETLNLFIPRLMGGASQEEGSDKMTEKLQQLVQENATSQEEVNNMMKGLTGSLTYWEISQELQDLHIRVP